ncbi:Altered inheritance of mitochondria protein 32 [Escovopsis weberi]|uniref:Altered inheritance of mitochondria protein 32 n=1 Tax=Escovopsis weberi TaxID=150374 RepID=A0A0M8N1P3_ESCWE|nr:Altered inheritance of mitochondria protein 32 [Escovopsis weberi]
MPPRIHLLAHLRPGIGNILPSSRHALPVEAFLERGPRHFSRLRAPRPPPFPTVDSCPPASCACAPTPELPPGVEIDRTTALNGVVAGYAEQVLVCTGREDWAARIEDEDRGENLAASLRGLFGRGGAFCDPYHNVSILNSSFPSEEEAAGTSAYLLPSFKFIPDIAYRDPDALRAVAKAHILPRTLHPAHDGMPKSHRDRLVRGEEEEDGGRYAGALRARDVRDVRDVMVLICGHGGRDVRCGVMGPTLRDEFGRALGRLGYAVETGRFGGEDKEKEKAARVARVGLEMREGMREQMEMAVRGMRWRDVGSEMSNPISGLAISLQQASVLPPIIRATITNINPYPVTLATYGSPLDSMALAVGVPFMIPEGASDPLEYPTIKLKRAWPPSGDAVVGIAAGESVSRDIELKHPPLNLESLKGQQVTVGVKGRWMGVLGKAKEDVGAEDWEGDCLFVGEYEFGYVEIKIE